MSSVLMANTRASTSIGWVISSIESFHICNSYGDFSDYAPMDLTLLTSLGEMQVHGRGKVSMEWLLPNGETPTATLKAVWYIPDFPNNHLSISALQRSGISFSFAGCSVYIEKGGYQIGQGGQQDGVPMLSLAFPTWKIKRATERHVQASANAMDIGTWHLRMAHLGQTKVRHLVDMAEGIVVTTNGNSLGMCDDCITKERHFRKPPVTTTAKLQLVHVDVYAVGPQSFEGDQFFIAFTDDFTRAMRVYPMKDMSKFWEATQHYKTWAEGETGHTIGRFRLPPTVTNATKVLLEQAGMKWESKDPNESLTHRLVTRFFRLLRDSRLPEELWPEALSTTAYLRNRSPQRALIAAQTGGGALPLASNARALKTPFELWYGRKPDLSRVRIFGSKAYAHNLEVSAGRALNGRSVLCYLLGYGDGYYRLWNPHMSKIVPCSEVTIIE